MHVALVWSHQEHRWMAACVPIALHIAKSTNNILCMPWKAQLELTLYIIEVANQ